MAKTSSQSQKISTTTSKAKNDDSNNKNKKKEATTKVKKRTRKSIPQASPTPRRSSIYRGVTRHRWTGRYEAHLWDKNCLNESSNKKGRQVYLGAYDDEEAAAHAYDLAALKYWGPDTPLNFPVSNYEKQLKEMEGRAREEYIGSLRRTSSGFSRGVSKYRGVARHHHNGRWEARIGRVFGNKYLYLGTYATQEEAAAAYDMAAIEYRGLNAVTNFDLSRYIKRLHPNNKTNLENNQPKPLSNNEVNLLSNFPLHTTQLDNSTTSGSSSELSTTTTPNGASSSSSSALGLLLKSPKFKEMLERNTTNIVDSPLTSITVDQPRRSFPDDIQTYFDCNNNDSSNYYVDGDHDIIFGGLNALDSSIFQCEL